MRGVLNSVFTEEGPESGEVDVREGERDPEEIQGGARTLGRGPFLLSLLDHIQSRIFLKERTLLISIITAT